MIWVALFNSFLCRSTQYSEPDVYLCESVYDEVNKRVVKGVPDGLKVYQHSKNVQTDEVYFFKNPIVPQKVGTKFSFLWFPGILGTPLFDTAPFSFETFIAIL